ncbi:MAG: VWA domain-containing protein [Spirochaetaceae bacterium]|jgi:Mg-chelatase subunit ChlD|nr:VWA domain-containing protein [Spirochaetaceae bacterium]
MRCIVFSTLLFFFGVVGTNAQDLSIYDSDLWVSQGADGGFHLFIRKKPDIASVLLTETTRDPSLQEDNYAYRASQWNPINGNERRIIDGAVIPPENNIWSLIDSTPEYIAELGEVFHIYIPYLLNFGYESTRHGEVYVGDGTYLNVRAFEFPYGDYRGSFKDNPFLLRITQEERLAEDNFMKDAGEAYQEMADLTGGRTHRSVGPADIVETVAGAIVVGEGSLDLVFCVDTTASMKDDIETLKKELSSVLDLVKNRFSGFRVGMVLYRDYFDDYVTKVIPFTRDIKTFQKNIDGIRVRGGRDIPEAVHEAIHDAATQFPWQADSRQIILIGDAPPHPRPRGNISKEQAYNAALERGIRVDTILLPQ